MSSLRNEQTQEIIYLDAVLEEQWNEPANVTEHPIDRRSPVSDHIQPLQRTLFLRVAISGVNTDENLAFYSKTGPDRYLGVRDLLRAQRGSTFNYLSTRTGEIQRLALKGMRYSIDPRERVIYSLDFVQISYAQTEQGKLPPVPRKKKRDDPPAASGPAGFGGVPKGAPLFESRTRALFDLIGRALP